jgi:hypothetical protein
VVAAGTPESEAPGGVCLFQVFVGLYRD